MRKELLSGVFIVTLLAAMIPAILVRASPGPGLVGLWHFDGNALDDSGYGNDGTVSGASFVPGKFAQALNFDGVDDRVSVPHTAVLDITSAITIEAWINPDSVGNYQELVSKGDYLSGTGTFTYFILTMPNGKIRFGINLGATGDYVDSTSSVTTATWQHVAATFNPTTDVVKIYINGALDNSGTIINNPSSTSHPLFIGALKNGASVLNPFDGKIDEVRIWNVALDEDEIRAGYKTTAILYLEDLRAEIGALDPGDLKKPAEQRRETLYNKIDAALNQIEHGNYEGAIRKLEHDIMPKLGGTAPPSWLRVEHGELAAKIALVIGILGSL